MVALPSPFVPLLYHTLRDLSRGFFNFFYFFGWWLHWNWLKRWVSLHTVTHGVHQFPTSLVTNYFPLDTLIVSQLGWFVKGFFTFFFESPDFITTLALWWLLGCLTSPLDTLIISQVLRLVKGFFNFFCQGRLLGGVALGDFHSVVALSPLDNDSIPHSTPKVNR